MSILSDLVHFRVTWRSFHRWRRGIGPRLLVRVLLFSSAITLLLTSFQLYFEYRYEVRAIESRMSEIEGSYLQSLGGSLWTLDSRQIELQIEGILRLPAMRFVEVRETTDRANPLVVSGGHRQEHAALRRVFSLVHTSRGDQEQLGVLSIEATFDEVYRALLQRAIIILIREGTEIFLVSFFILSLTHRLVTRHLTALAGFLGTYDVRQPPPPLRLQRRAPKDKDELDHVLAAFERMRQSLERAYEGLERGYEALQESEQRFRDYAETASDWFWATGLDHAFTYFSEQASFRRDWGTLIGKCRLDVAADVASEPEHWRQHMATLERREPFRDFVHQVQYVDGTLGFVSISGKPVWDAEGRFAGYRGVARDITERQRAEEALRRSEAFLAEGQKLSHAGSWSFKPDGTCDYWSRELYEILGFDPKNGIPTISDYFTRVHPGDREIVEATIQRMIAAGEGCDLKKRIIRPDGVQRVIRCVGMPVREQGVVTRFVGTLVDITEQEELTQELRRSQAYLAEAQRLSHTGSSAHNPATGAIHYWSEETCRIWGFDPRQPPPDSSMILQRIHLEDRDRAREGYLNAVLERKDYDQECRIIRPDGAVRNIHVVGHPVFSGSGELIEYFSTHIDITERKRADAALQEARAELERVSRVTTMGELAASIAHEINQPLAGVVSSANAGLNWLAANPPNLSKTREALERIQRDGTRGGEVLARIRAFLKRTPPARTLVSVNQIVRDVLALVSGELRQHHIELSLELAPTLPGIRGDSVQLQQVLLNLIKNAIEAMAGITNGQRTLRIQSRLGELDGQPMVVVEVSDTGIGLSSNEATRLFEAFHTTKPQGMGMGLWISRSIIESHHGRLTASSNHGPGATFVITLPKASQEQA